MNGHWLEAERPKRAFLNSIILSVVFHCALIAMVLSGGNLSASPRLLLKENTCLFVDLVTSRSEGKANHFNVFKKTSHSNTREVMTQPQVVATQHQIEKTSLAKQDPPSKSEGVTSEGLREVTTISDSPSGTGKNPGSKVDALSEGSSPGEMYLSKAIPRYGYNPPPHYPQLARLRGQEGLVLLTVEVLPDGRVGQVVVKQSSGYSLLDHSAIEAVKKWSFIPGKRMGIPITMWVDIPIRFALK